MSLHMISSSSGTAHADVMLEMAPLERMSMQMLSALAQAAVPIMYSYVSGQTREKLS